MTINPGTPDPSLTEEELEITVPPEDDVPEVDDDPEIGLPE